ncbi:hypothetical protein ADU37_CDS11670 [Thermococcus sp. 2319x1]|nr:hypothetical protein ADU37_CDS11670 [Thermococcus sp. 2319x1]
MCVINLKPEEGNPGLLALKIFKASCRKKREPGVFEINRT